MSRQGLQVAGPMRARGQTIDISGTSPLPAQCITCIKMKPQGTDSLIHNCQIVNAQIVEDNFMLQHLARLLADMGESKAWELDQPASLFGK